ncbi:hypothetical protein RRG08_041131 [Elysia crispata]|uniref:Uncharacterized protein n=1 Tax=Elysia crispata TaxID=231223 RepID=A0AAE0XYS3_9GAST|nr:hypothetical protein RRG08_041131 [Elysia crispata]
MVITRRLQGLIKQSRGVIQICLLCISFGLYLSFVSVVVSGGSWATGGIYLDLMARQTAQDASSWRRSPGDQQFVARKH